VKSDHRFDPARAPRLNDPRRLSEQVSEDDLARLLSLKGAEDVADLGSGTGFYTDIVARLTSGTVYAVEVSARMIEAYRARGVPINVRLVQADLRQPLLEPSSVDVVYSVVTLHETGGDMGMMSLLQSLRTPGRVVAIDWRAEPASWDSGPPASIRISDEAAADIFRPYFQSVSVEHLGDFLFALVAHTKRSPSPQT